MSNFTRPKPERIKEVHFAWQADPVRICLSIAYSDGSAYNRQANERFPADVLDWLCSHIYWGHVFHRHAIEWIDYEPINKTSHRKHK